MHKTYNRLQAIANEYKSVAYAGPPTSSASSIGTDNESYISALKETLARLTTERELAFAVTARSAKRTPSNTMATNTMIFFLPAAHGRDEKLMEKVLAAATTAAKVGTGNRGGGTGGGGTGGVGTGVGTGRGHGGKK
jgi:hypothetical protein